jgi:hypothetical protein
MSYKPSPNGEAVMGSLRLRHALPAVAAAFVAVLLGSSAAFASTGHTGFGFNAPSISGGSGSIFLTGGGAFDSTSLGFVHSAGGFRCTSTVSSGPLAGCLAGQGVRWDIAALLQSTPFKCTATDPSGVKTATTTDDTAVLRADFYRAGDGNNDSFTANIFVSTEDLAPDVPDVQNVWVQGVGCGSAVAHFSH